ncbi:hypothetical protein [Treponema sp. Marseille-Q4523]|uniref:hypothetical protein n=1 Tax=Treponema sp. Marseille-Q4523 TaxID=2810610 RepID=UPI0019612B99|nr:hypothetical protein [Treponema sp. Marseille-Q4523]MBM7024227.1 hypothetical protein [Treponema sp. Marseille-Q4523]
MKREKEQTMTINDIADYLDGVGLQYLATNGLDGKPKVRPVQYCEGRKRMKSIYNYGWIFLLIAIVCIQKIKNIF